MDLGTSTRRKLSPEELNQRVKEDLCRYCGEPGHYIKNCPKSTSNLTKRPYSSRNSKTPSYRLGSSQKESKEDLPVNNLLIKSKNDRSLF